MARLGSSTPGRRKTRTAGLKSLALRFLVAVDIEGFSQRYAAEQARTQYDLELAIARASASAGLERERWYRQPSGDGELAVLQNLDPDAFRRVIVRAKGITYVGYLCQANLGMAEPDVPTSREPMLS